MLVLILGLVERRESQGSGDLVIFVKSLEKKVILLSIGNHTMSWCLWSEVF